ncbi:MAG: hypothetical protein BWK78_02280, partial [Thiotrichaceae bacterium IS1]
DVYLAMGSLESQDCKGVTTQTRQAALRENQQRAKESLHLAKGFADEIKHPLLQASILNQQGNLWMTQKNYEEALKKYGEATVLAEQDKLLKAKILMNIAQTMVTQDTNHEEAQKAIENATTEVGGLSDSNSHDKSFALIALARFWEKLQKLQSSENSQSSPPVKEPEFCSTESSFKQKLQQPEETQRFNLLTLALDANKIQEDRRAVSYAKGYLAGLYLEKWCYSHAKELTEQAIFYAQTYPHLMTGYDVKNIEKNVWGYPELLFQWEWQLGKILKTQVQSEQAIGAYGRAAGHLEVARKNYASTTPTFGKDGETFYSERADLLLQLARVTTGEDDKQNLLKAAIDSIESRQAASLRNYFRDECITEISPSKDEKKFSLSHTAVFYPILLQDGNVSNEMIKFSLNLGEDGVKLLLQPSIRTSELKNQVYAFRQKIEEARTKDQKATQDGLDRKEVLQKHLEELLRDHAQPLYQLLIDPIVGELDKYQIDTLIIIPDGTLYTLPFAALHDGKQFLIEKYALVVTPGLQLTNLGSSMPRDKIAALLNGLSEKVEGFGQLDARQALDDISKVQELTKVDRLEDETFTITNLQKSFRNPYSIVHFTTHGHFDKDPNNTFLLTYESVADPTHFLTINHLQELLSDTGKPIDLLTLSACESALGDENAALGLAGVALQTGIHSALATLWRVDANAANHLIRYFYNNIANKQLVTKAQMLKDAQKELRTEYNGDYSHPYFWAGFLLVGNWF